MTVKKTEIAIIGAGLSGLASAVLLNETGKKVCILEARHTAGGRIRSVFSRTNDKVLADIGPTWVWPEYQPVIANWIEKLQLRVFPQFDTGNALLDYGPETTPVARFLPGQHGSMRVEGGSQALVDAMVSRLSKEDIIVDTRVTQVEAQEDRILISTDNKDLKTIKAQKVIVASPPRIAMNTIMFQPALPNELQNALDMMPTWMAPHAKVSAIYESAFWRDQGLSGRIASQAGPIVEAHDHCSADGSIAALWGFIGWPHEMRIEMGEAKLKQEVLAQLKRCFGSDSPDPISLTIEEWSQDRFVTSPNDLTGPMHHPSVGPESLRRGYAKDRIFFASAETAKTSPGLIEGAFDSANRVASMILAK